jgi:Sensors of blue-light using FAD
MTQPQHTGLHRLTYLSSASGEMRPADLDAILESARENNRRNEVTGLLLYHDLQFFQALEGVRAQIEETFARIKKSRHHKGCLVLESRPIEQRLFDGWAMAYRSIGELDTSQKQNFLDMTKVRARYAEGDSNGDARTRILIDSFLSSFRDLDLP